MREGFLLSAGLNEAQKAQEEKRGAMKFAEMTQLLQEARTAAMCSQLCKSLVQTLCEQKA